MESIVEMYEDAIRYFTEQRDWKGVETAFFFLGIYIETWEEYHHGKG